jgi:dephospho-CoA kinase
LLSLKKLAVTGGLASGKSSVCQILKKYGAYVVSTDEIVHQLLSLNTPQGDQILALLGEEVVHHNQFDRKKIANIVFNDYEKLKDLEKILHPLVFREIEKQYQTIKQLKEYPLFVVEIPLLYEGNKSAFFDLVLAVVADSKLCKKRFSSPEDYDRRMGRQLSQEEKAAKANT